MNDAGIDSLRMSERSTSLRAVLAPVLPAFDPETSPGGVHSRRATIGDLEALVDLENASFAVERMSARQWRRHLESLSAEIFVAIRERRVIGACVLFFRRSNRVARLYSMAVAASERGRGIGELLLTAIEQAARRRGCSVLRLEVRAENSAARRLYERHGYRRFGFKVSYYEDGHDAVRYEKPLDQGTLHAL